MKLTATLEQEQEANQKRLQDLMLMMRHSDEQENEVRTFIKEIRRYATIEELDEAVLNRLISKILVSEVKKIDGQKVQEVRIIYNFVGEIPEITVFGIIGNTISVDILLILVGAFIAILSIWIWKIYRENKV